MEQFIYALTDAGYVMRKSQGVDRVLQQETIRKLKALKENTQFLWPAPDDCITISTVSPIADGYGRRGYRNHTLIIQMMEYARYTQPERLLSQFRWNGDSVPEVLETIKL